MSGRSTRAPRRRRRPLRIVLLSLGALLAVAVLAFLTWSSIVMGPDPEALARVDADPAVAVERTDNAIVMSPTDDAGTSLRGTGLVFVPGAKVDAASYEATLAPLVEEGASVVITRPILHLAFFDLRSLETFTEQADGVDEWLVGGHSLGGVKACQWGDDPEVAGLVLLGSYCANDLSASGLPVLSLSGSEDGLSTPAKVAAASGRLPADAVSVEIDGANHAAFGWYGPQPGDGTATISHEESDAEIAEALLAFAAERG
ncbi:alpha/beta hydrolase [Rathayibacter sp. VKM Ac-2856]|uniref:alpha/beta hydrolase n=1 Tax=unclassified Rathayibacter TaxID=2609250 RepID=UPI001567BAC8|nr:MULTISPECIES: alpha/beta hydrolase [unclassified Rathayibacter]NQX06320.1 alpha/beta hydrolase [Rathayibacter sp. VKM Ac-2858]NQX21487.1 alpha/beta hydrolase [Rathayibacter sp. VKM Ac-2856]